LFGCGVKSKRVGFFHVSHFSIYLVNALVFNGKANLERRGFRPKIFDDIGGRSYYLTGDDRDALSQSILEYARVGGVS
jgi:hypothetical protein